MDPACARAHVGKLFLLLGMPRYALHIEHYQNRDWYLDLDSNIHVQPRVIV